MDLELHFFALVTVLKKNIAIQDTHDYTGKYLTGSEIVKRANEEGHLIATHSYNHLALPGLTDEGILNKELSRTKNIIISLIGKSPLYIRPPYSSVDDRVSNITRALGLKTILWSCHSADSFTESHTIPNGSIRYKYEPVDIYDKVMRNTEKDQLFYTTMDTVGTTMQISGLYLLYTELSQNYRKRDSIL